jgi:hypothetical protein
MIEGGCLVNLRWEYCLLTCTPMSGVDDVGIRLVGQLAGPDWVTDLEVQRDDPSPLGAVSHVLNDLGEKGWELIAYDTTTNRGVFKRVKNLGEE